MKLIVGLGNPGKEFEATRHSIGFSIVNYLAKKYKETFELDKNLESEVVGIKMNGKKVVLAKPQTFMNSSGRAVRKLSGKYKSKPEDITVIHDDLDIPFGKVKLSFERGTAGHKGVESIIKALKTEKFYRVRVGTFNQQIVKIRKIRDKRKRLNAMNKFVIGSFGQSEKLKLNKLIKTAAEKAVQL